MKHVLSKLVHKGTEQVSEKEISVESKTDGRNKYCQIRLFDERKAVEIDLTKEELSEFIGLMLHVQSQLKR